MIEIARLPVTLPNSHVWTPPQLDEPLLVMLAELVNLFVRRGDTIELEGDLGAGKSTFARAVIRASLGDDAAEVPSPTFSLVQTYPTPRLLLTHADLYRLRSAEEVAELGLDEARMAGAVLVEWPERQNERQGGRSDERLGGRDVTTGLHVQLGDAEGSAWRMVTLTAFGGFKPRLVRLIDIWEFLAAEWADAMPMRVRYLQGDASARAYARLESADTSLPMGKRILMDSARLPDGPPVRDGLPYSRIAHLAEDVRPFVAIAGYLQRAGALVPAIHAHDLDRGLLLIDDLGDGVFSRLVAEDRAHQAPLWTAAVDALVELRQAKPGLTLPLPDGSTYILPRYDASALGIETDLLIDWLWPAEYGTAVPADVAHAYHQAWMPILRRLGAMADGLVLRDFHSPNLLSVVAGTGDAAGPARVGIIDFQDAVLGPVAYDLASLLLDARVDVPPELERDLLARYLAAAAARDRDFDRAAFEFAYASLGVQRNTKILGIFARLSRRDGKHIYLTHLPRIWRYLERGLRHPDLAALRAWYDAYWPQERRRELGRG